jgi:hypothetical protein
MSGSLASKDGIDWGFLQIGFVICVSRSKLTWSGFSQLLFAEVHFEQGFLPFSGLRSISSALFTFAPINIVEAQRLFP